MQQRRNDYQEVQIQFSLQSIRRGRSFNRARHSRKSSQTHSLSRHTAIALSCWALSLPVPTCFEEEKAAETSHAHSPSSHTVSPPSRRMFHLQYKPWSSYPPVLTTGKSLPRRAGVGLAGASLALLAGPPALGRAESGRKSGSGRERTASFLPSSLHLPLPASSDCRPVD